MPINSFLYPGAKVTPAYDVANSLRFNDGETQYLTRTASSGSYGTTYTISFWFKQTKQNDAHEQYIYMGGDQDTANNLWIRLQGTARTLYLRSRTSSSNDCVLITNRVFRDPAAWTHIVYEIDTTQGTASNRVKLYVNGVQETSFGTETYPDQNDTFKIATSGKNQDIGRRTDGSSYNNFGLMLAEFCLIDGTALDKDSFGEFDEDSPLIWKPKSVSGLTFGTNGFYLDFEDSSALGNDVSGNNNDFSSSGLAATDQSTDTCTNNFATMNPLTTSSYGSLQQGNLRTVGINNADVATTFGTMSTSNSGKWYWEIKINNTTSTIYPHLGIGNDDNPYIGQNVNGNATFTGGSNFASPSFHIRGDGKVYIANSTSNTYDSFTTDDIIQFAVDLDNGASYLGKNGTFMNSGNPASGSSKTGAITTWTAGTISGFLPMVVFYYGAAGAGNSAEVDMNFGNPVHSISSGNSDANGFGNFEYSVPSGYFSLCTKNLAEYG